MEKRLIDIKELSEYLSIKPQTIRNRMSAGSFPIRAFRVCGRIRFDRRDVERYLDRLKPHYVEGGVDTERHIGHTTS